MKLIITIVSDVSDLEQAEGEYKSVEENYQVVSAKLDGEDYHPALHSIDKVETGSVD